MQNWNFVSPHKYPSTNVCHYMWTVHQHGSSVITVLFAGSLSLCVLTVRAGGPRFYHVLHTALCHMPSLSSWKLFYFYLFYVVLLFSQFLGQCAHTSASAECVFYELCATKRMVAAPVCEIYIKLQIRALTCSGDCLHVGTNLSNNPFLWVDKKAALTLR